MKKTLFACAIVLAALFAACEGNTKTEDVGVGANKGVEALEALSESDTTTFACSCGHKCKTKEECEKNCGEDCEMMKK